LRSILVRADNSLAATGSRQNSEFGEDMILARFNSNGALDLTYAVEGVATADFGIRNNAPASLGSALIQQADGKIIAVGPTSVGTLSAARFDDGATFPGIIGFINTNQTVAEATATVVYTVRRTGGSYGSVSVDYATAAGQALTGSDFQDAAGTLSWDAGDTSDRSITINLIDDAEVEGDENFSLTLSEPTGGAALAASEAGTNIANDDSASGDGDGDGGGDGGGGGAFGAWSLAFLCGLFFRRQRATQVRRVARLLVQGLGRPAISRLERSACAANTIRARIASACEVLCRRAHSTSRLFCSAVSTIGSTFGPRRMRSPSKCIPKYFYNYWRPVTAIRAADTDGNDATEPDAEWLPLAPTPNHPEYPAAHGGVSTAYAEALRHFFGTKKVTITLSNTVTGTTQTFHSTDEIIKEIAARVYDGMHYRTSGVHGSVIGRKVAHWIDKNYFQPVAQ
jgi:hypothetical protein